MKKQCGRCGRWLDLADFYDRRDGAYGKSGRCKDCLKEINKIYREKKKLEKEQYTDDQVREGKVLLMERAAMKANSRCSSCSMKALCRERVSKGLWLLCEIPDRADVRRVAATKGLIGALWGGMEVELGGCNDLVAFVKKVDELYLEDVK
jgi:hypothetical protein